MGEMVSCHNCATPPGSCIGKGRHIEVTAKPEYGDKRTRKATVWCCSDECAVQSLAIAKYGAASHKWPISLAKFRTMHIEP